MRVLLALPLLQTVLGSFDSASLLNHIRQATLNYDQMVDSVKNREEDQIHKIELKERDVDRQLEAVVNKYHLDKPTGFSLLERRKRHRHRSTRHQESPQDQVIPKYSHLKKIEVHEIVPEADLKAMESAELAREDAEAQLVKVEADVAKLPEKLFHTAERNAKKNKFVPLDEDEGDDDGDDDGDDVVSDE